MVFAFEPDSAGGPDVIVLERGCVAVLEGDVRERMGKCAARQCGLCLGDNRGVMGRPERLTQWAVDEGVADDFLKAIDWYNLDWRTKTYADGEKIQDYFVRLFEKKPKAEIVAGLVPQASAQLFKPATGTWTGVGASISSTRTTGRWRSPASASRIAPPRTAGRC